MSGHADFARWCESEGIDTVVAGAGDTHGIWRGKPKIGMEYEFYVFRGDLEALRASGWRLEPIHTLINTRWITFNHDTPNSSAPRRVRYPDAWWTETTRHRTGAGVPISASLPSHSLAAGSVSMLVNASWLSHWA
jgi:hypothetical protein